MQEMITAQMDALVIKTAAFGLDPEKHLGKAISALFPHFSKLNSEFGFHVCGEGGEFETLVIDCPLFKKKIIMLVHLL
jgi:diphthine-ammonia ligase